MMDDDATGGAARRTSTGSREQTIKSRGSTSSLSSSAAAALAARIVGVGGGGGGGFVIGASKPAAKLAPTTLQNRFNQITLSNKPQISIGPPSPCSPTPPNTSSAAGTPSSPLPPSIPVSSSSSSAAPPLASAYLPPQPLANALKNHTLFAKRQGFANKREFSKSHEVSPNLKYNILYTHHTLCICLPSFSLILLFYPKTRFLYVVHRP